MTIVNQTAANEAVRERQRAAMLAAVDLLGHDLPPAYFSVHDHHDIARLHVGIGPSTSRDMDKVQANLRAWLKVLGIEEFAERSHPGSVKLAATGMHMGVEVVLNATVYTDPKPVKVQVRTVTA